MEKKKISKKSLYLRIAAGVAGFVLLCICVTFTMSFTGNPISSFMAKKAAKEYVANKYPEYDMVIKDSMYNFKIGGYDVDVQDKNSQDICFSVWYRDFDGIVGDNYEEMVVEQGSTVVRLENEMGEEVKRVIYKYAEDKGLKISGRCYTSLFKYISELKRNNEKLPSLNTPFSKELGLKGEYFIDFTVKNELTNEEIADIINEIYDVLTENDLGVEKLITSYKTAGTDDEMTVSVDAELINDELAENIEYALRDDEIHEGIYVYSSKYRNGIITEDTK